jgi:hypothetical protein
MTESRSGLNFTAFLKIAGALALLLALSSPSIAQPLTEAEEPTPTPRWADGHPNLGSTPGATGYWEIRPGGGGGIGYPRTADIPMRPWTRALGEYRGSLSGVYPPGVNCKATGGPGFFNSPGFELVEVPELEKLFILNIAGPHSWRVIYMDGREHPEDLRPTYLGHSVGRWEGDTLIIDSVGFNEKLWMRGSAPTTNQLHLTERITRPNLQTINYEVTFDDPGAYTAPWTGGWEINMTTGSSWIDGGEPFEYICQDSRL